MKSALSRRSFLRTAGIALGGAALAACGATATPTSPPKPTATTAAAAKPTTAPAAAAPTAVPAAKGPITLAIAWWGGQARNKLYNDICDVYQKRNPNITITRESADWAPYWTKVATQVAAKALPDITASVIDTLTEFSLRGAYVVLDPFMDNKTIDVTDWP